LLPLTILTIGVFRALGRQVVVVESMQMLSGHVARLSEAGHAALTGELIRAVLQWNDGVGRSGALRLGRHIHTAENGRGRVARRAESGHAALAGELIRAAL